MAVERVGLDPLAEAYRRLLGEHATDRTRHVNGSAERMPFADASFAIVTFFNSLDHMRDDLEAAAAEIKRVLRPGGSFLLMTELGHPARLTEPQEFSREVIEPFEPRLRRERRYEDTGFGIDRSLLDAIPFDAAAPPTRVCS